MKAVVIGGGAAGTMAAIFAAAGGAETLLLERTKDGGRKILISGGGRCNILPSELDESRFVTDSSPHALRKIVRSWPLRDQIRFFERDLELPLVEEPGTGKLFPRSDRARDVRDALMAHARARGVQIVPECRVTNVAPGARGWSIAREAGDPISADAVIVATGGLSVPSTGSDGTGLSLARQLGHQINQTYPALTPLLAPVTSAAPIAPVAPGLSLSVTLSAVSPIRRATASGGFLFTHTGYSGPAVLDVSHVAVRSLDEETPAALTVRWTERTDHEWHALLRAQGSRTVMAVVADEVPRRLAGWLLARAGIAADCTLSQLDRSSRHQLVEGLMRCPLTWSGHEGYRKAEVTGGGLDLSDVDPATLQSRRHPGLFFCGEVLDAFGPIGGYNFFWAWATGRLAGIAAAGTHVSD